MEHSVDLLTTANAVIGIEEGILTPIISLFMEMDNQYREDAITIRAYGELGQEVAMEKIEPIQMDARYSFRWFGVEQARNAQQMQQQIAMINVVQHIPGQLYPQYVLDVTPVLVDLVDEAFGPMKGRTIFKKVNSPETMQMKQLQLMLGGAAQANPANKGGHAAGGKAGAGPKPGAQPGQQRPAQQPPGAVHKDNLGQNSPMMPRKVAGMM
jgi:hypothetical protein